MPVALDTWSLVNDDCRRWIASLSEATFDAVITDPPYHINTAATDAIMPWDKGTIAFDAQFWSDLRRVCTRGSHLAAFAHPRLYHRLAIAIEDGGWTLTEPIFWAHAHMMRKHAGALKPGATPIVVARNGGSAGYPGITDTRLPTGSIGTTLVCSHAPGCEQNGWRAKPLQPALSSGEQRTWYEDGYIKPRELRNIVDGHLVAPVWTCEQGCPVQAIEHEREGAADYFSVLPPDDEQETTSVIYANRPVGAEIQSFGGKRHPTQKPVSLLSHLVKLLSTEGQVVADPFTGTATTGVAALGLGRRFSGAEADADFYQMATQRLAQCAGLPPRKDLCPPTFGDLVGRLFDPDET